jgi:hypothetical protein
VKIRPAGAELLHADRRKDRHDEVNGRFSQFCKIPRRDISYFPKISYCTASTSCQNAIVSVATVAPALAILLPPKAECWEIQRLMASNGITFTSSFLKIGWLAHKLGMDFHITSQRPQSGQKIQACNVTWLPHFWKSADLKMAVCYPGSLTSTLARYKTSSLSASVVDALQPPCTIDILPRRKHFSSQLNLIQTQRRWRQHIPPNRLNKINIVHSTITKKSVIWEHAN